MDIYKYNKTGELFCITEPFIVYANERIEIIGAGGIFLPKILKEDCTIVGSAPRLIDALETMQKGTPCQATKTGTTPYPLDIEADCRIYNPPERQAQLIRKLTPLECWRLMGFSDEAFYKAKAAGISDSQLYKQAGNSIVVDALVHICKPLEEVQTVNELFSGIGAQTEALKKLGIPHKVIGISEIDKFSIQSYEAMHGKTHNYGDIRNIKSLDYADLWTYSFPCQDLSVAGRREGIKRETRSGLLLEVERLLNDAVVGGLQPKYLLLENVKNLVGKKFKPDFDLWLEKLNLLGYNNYWQVLNAKDYGVPQNRERVFVVSIRKDLDIKGYKFPEKIPLDKKLKDVLEPEVAEKYYLSDETVKYYHERTRRNAEKGNGFAFKPHTKETSTAFAITTRAGSRMVDNFYCNC